jgi:cell division protein FtsB
MPQHEEMPKGVPREMNEEMNERESWSTHGNPWLIFAVVVALIIAGISFTYGYGQQATVHQLTAQAKAAQEALSQTQDQVSAMTARINDLTIAQQAATEALAKAKQPAKSGGSGKASAAAEKRYKQLEAKIADSQQQLKETQDQVAKNRADLEGSLGSTRDELNGSIARTHEELVALAKRGERSYFEFDLNKSSDFQHIGPISLSLRKADTKHKCYDLAMFVDDNRLNKKKVNLYEPVWIHTENESQPVQIVVNKIQKNHVHGYVSAPKYGPSELARAGSATVVPAKAPVATPNNPPSEQPEQTKQPDEPERRLPRP